MYQVIFRGERVAGVDEFTARSNIEALFKASASQIERMFSGQPVVIRNNLDEEGARKYQQVLARHGVICHLELMPGAASAPAASTPPKPASEPAPAAAPSPNTNPRAPAAPAGTPALQGIQLEPGDRPKVAGDKVDEILSGLSMGLEPPGSRLSDPVEVETPVFEHLDEITLAPVGSTLGVPQDAPPPIVPDTDHLKLVDEEPR